MRLAIAISRFNSEITNGLLEGAKQYCEEKNLLINPKDIFEAPGAFELPLLAQELAKSKHYDGVICLGCVIKGDTAHFEFISLGTAVGLQQTMLECRIPISFGVLTTYTEEQALVRSRKDAANKGREAAAACFELATTLSRIRDTK